MNGPMPFLQVLPYQTSMNPKYVAPIAVLIGMVVVLRIYLTWKETRKTATKKQKVPVHGEVPHSTQVQETVSSKELKAVSKLFSFTAEQSEFFAKICKKKNIIHPAQFIQDKAAVDALFTSLLHELEVAAASRESERQKTLVFFIREAIDNRRKAGELISSTRALKTGIGFSMTVESGEQYQSAVTENSTEGIQCLIPRDLFGNELRLPIRSQLELFFTGAGGQSYRCKTKILQYRSHRTGTHFLLAHTDSVTALPNRKHDRKSIQVECTFCHVTVANVVNGKKTEHKFFPSKKTYPGLIHDISAGGCSISVSEQLPIGEYLQIQCILMPGNTDTIIGKVVRITGEVGTGDLNMHIQFAKMPRVTMNRIYSIIYHREGTR